MSDVTAVDEEPNMTAAAVKTPEPGLAAPEEEFGATGRAFDRLRLDAEFSWEINVETAKA